MFKIAKEDVAAKGGENYYKNEFVEALNPFMSNPCLKNAINLLEISPVLYPYFEQSKSKEFRSEIKKNFMEGQESAKLSSHRQAMIRAIIHGIILGVSFFNPFRIYIKLIILVVLLFLFGVVASSKKYKGKL